MMGGPFADPGSRSNYVCDEVLSADLASAVADRAAATLQAQPSGTWVKLRMLEKTYYAEGDGGPPPGKYPVFVSVLKADSTSQDQMAAEAAALTGVIAELCDRRPENVHVHYQPATGSWLHRLRRRLL